MRTTSLLLVTLVVSAFGCSSADFSVANTSPADGSVDAADDTANGSDTTTIESSLPDSVPTEASPVEVGPPPGSDAACQAFAEALCQRFQNCSPFLVQVEYGTVSACAPRAKAECLAFMSAPAITMTPKRLGDCAIAYGDASNFTCDDLLVGNVPSACVAAGTLANGAICSTNLQCQSGACEISAGSVCGTCVAGIEGGPCVTACGPNLKCTNGTCARYRGLADTCDSGKPCYPTMTCISGKCSPDSSSTGLPCIPDPGTTVTTVNCNFFDGLYCQGGGDVTAKSCQPYNVSTVSQPCGVVSGRMTACVGGTACSTSSTGTGLSCVADLPDGASCSLASGTPQCSPFARCAGGKCMLLDPSACH